MAAFTKQQFEEPKRRVRERLRADVEARGAEAAAERLFAECAAVKRGDDDTGHFETFVQAASLLVHHLRWGGIGGDVVRQVLETAESTVQLLAYRYGAAEIGFVWYDYYLVRSLVHVEQGEPWDAAWMKRSASRFVGPDAQRSLIFNRGASNLRLGFAVEAAVDFLEAEAALRDDLKRVATARLNRMKAQPRGFAPEARADSRVAKKAQGAHEAGTWSLLWTTSWVWRTEVKCSERSNLTP